MMNDVSYQMYQPYQPTISSAGLQHYHLYMEAHAAGGILSSLVHRFIKISATQATDYPVIPDATHALYFSQNGSLLSGGLTQPINLRIPQAGEYFGIHFFPAALQRMFKHDFSETADAIVDAHFLPGEFINALQHIFYQESTFHAKVLRCQNLLLRFVAFPQSPLLAAVLSEIYAAGGDLRVEDLARNLGYSARHIQRLMRHCTGLNTKTFARIVRMQFAYRDLVAAGERDLKNCLRHGYYDQSHFLKEFSKLVGPAFFS